MTNDQINKFLTLLTGKCWHEWEEIFLTNNHTVSSTPTHVCKHCGIERFLRNENKDHLANPLPVLKWMEKEMPEVLEEYLCHISEVTVTNIDWIEEVINLRNLVDYLWEYQEWGEMECPNCDGYGVLEGFGEPEFHCQECHGTGKIIHKALQYLREVKG